MRIALCGEARSGKDTVAKLLGMSFERQAFGDYMKEGYYRENPHMVDQPKDREHMIAWSQPIVNMYNHVWIAPLEAYMKGAQEDYHSEINWVITDLRQPHEEKWCRDNGFHIVRVHAHVLRRDLRARNLGEKIGKDLPYEVKADYHIYNDGSLEDLQSQVDNLLDCLNEQEMKRRRL
ncbi:hypothetical protein OCB39_28815 [Bacillus cereus]|nr:hypothetical protein [Bacillus cereus]